MILEKLSKPLIQKIINKKINKNQFGFRPKSDCGIAKAMIFFQSRKYKYKKALLIDIKKAYDTVDLNKLKETINEVFDDENEKGLLINFINIYQGLILIINGVKINPTIGLPQGSSLSPIFFNLYINQVLDKIGKIKEIHIQAYADDIIILSNKIENIQKAYDQTKVEIEKIKLQINPDKCELISEEQNDSIKDTSENGEMKIINSVNQAKYLGQVINEEGVPINNVKSISFGYISSVIRKDGSLTKIAKIRIFQTYMRSRINHLIPMIVLTDGVSQLWKTVRKFIFEHLLEYNTLPRESASAFKLGYYEIIIRPVKKLIERNREFTNNKDEDDMLKECLKMALRNWLIHEPKHTEKLKNIIVDNIEGKADTSIDEMDKLINEEYSERLFRNHTVDENIVKKLRRIKSPSLITLISNEPEHEIKSRILKYERVKEKEKQKKIKDKIIQKILKIKTAIEYIQNYQDNEESDINKNINDINEQIIIFTIKEIKTKKKWEEIKETWVETVNFFVDKLILANKNKEGENINTSEVYALIEKLRLAIANANKEQTKDLEIALEIEEQNEFIRKIIDEKKEEIQQKKGPGRPKKKEYIKDNKQMKIDQIFNKETQ